ncbi:hypothetical protein KW805_01005 [Candidatus Pacearchaeota archaeon]|nr:hypothetical protein [Candidatus Pacearchaeota archaeon]
MKKQLVVGLVVVLIGIIALLILDSKTPISERYGQQNNSHIIGSGNTSEINNPPQNNNEQPTLTYYSPSGDKVMKNDLPTIKVTFPNGGNSLTIGTTTHITWESTHSADIPNVLIRISQVNNNPRCMTGEVDCATLGDIITQSALNTGSFEWKVANNDRDFSMPAGNYIISVVGVTTYTMNSSSGGSGNYNAFDSSDTQFTVKAASGY